MDIRPSPIAGTWYPGSAPELKRSVDSMLDQASRVDVKGKIIALVVPHAGHRYSGHVAASAYKQIRSLTPDLVIVASPIHRPYRAPILTSAHDAYGTPLGSIPVDQDALSAFNQNLERTINLTAFPVHRDQEHALEIQLPFLQCALKEPFRLLPIMISDTRPSRVEAVGHALAAAATKRNALIIASSDLSHFYPLEVARKLDHEMLSRITALQPDRVLAAEREGSGFACGRAAIAAVLIAAMEMGANASKLLSYATSGDITGDEQSVVGYGSVMLLQQP